MASSHAPRRSQLGAAALVVLLSLPAHAGDVHVHHRLAGWASLPADARWPGPTAGHFVSPGLPGTAVPFVGGQPIPGFSALLRSADGRWIAMPDNGFGTKGNSGDFVIGFYKAAMRFKLRGDGSTQPGKVTLRGRVDFNDANGLLKNGAGVDLITTADLPNYHTVNGNALADSGIPVDPRIGAGRLLTGFDFDVESIAPAADGSYWAGEEFGPYLLHFDAQGTLIDEPVPHPFLRSPANPEVMFRGATVTSASSRGFESLAFNGDRSRLYAVPEAAPTVDALRAVPGDERVINFFEFDPATRAYTGKNPVYRKDGPVTGNNIVVGDMANVGGNRFVLIERDSLFGANAVVKRLYLIDLDVTDADGVLSKRLLVDLLDVNDPLDIGGPLPGLMPKQFSFPFDSIESVAVLDDRRVVLAIDTNYPDEDGRVPGKPDDSEVILLEFTRSLASLPIVPRR
jgi:hypothetical protein